VPALVRDEPLLPFGVVTAAVAYALYALIRHRGFSSAYDLALFDQAVWHYSRFEPPRTELVFEYFAESGRWEPLPYLLGDHFHPLVAVLAPLYWIHASATTLLVAQAVLVASSAIPVFLFSRLRLGRLGAHLITAAYLLFWALHRGVGFDFHEVAFAPLLIACAIYFTAVERWRVCAASLVLLLLTKENFGIFVAFFGVYLGVLRHMKAAAAAFVGGVGWYALVTAVVMPRLAGGHEFRHWSFRAVGDDPLDALWRIVRSPELPFVVAVDDPVKAETLFFLFALFLGIALYSPVLVLAVPLIAERMLSSAPQLWGMEYHYSLAIAPVVAMGTADGLRNALNFLRIERRRLLTIGVLGTAMVVLNLVNARTYLVGDLLHPRFYRESDAARWGEEAVARIPPHEGSVASRGSLLPHLSERSELYLLEPGAPLTQYIAYRVNDLVLSPEDRATARTALAGRRDRYRLVYSGGPFRILERR
jgi:uncharacterized membrane protein